MLSLAPLLTPYAMPNPTGAVEGAAGTLSALGAQNHQQSQYDTSQKLRQQEQDFSEGMSTRKQDFTENTDARDFTQKQEDAFQSVHDAYSKMKAVDPKLADETFGPIFKAHGWTDDGSSKLDTPATITPQDEKEIKALPKEEASPANDSLPGESASNYIGRKQAAPPEAPPEPANEEEALAALEAAQKEADAKQAAPEAPVEGVPSDKQMLAPPPKTAAPMDAKPTDVAPAEQTPQGVTRTRTITHGMTGDIPAGAPPDLPAAASDQSPLAQEQFGLKSPQGNRSEFGAQPGQGQEMQRRMQQDANAFVAKISDPKIRAMAEAWLGGAVMNGTFRTPQQLADAEKEIMGLIGKQMTDETQMFMALHRPSPGGGGRTEPLNWKAGFDTAQGFGQKVGVNETDNSLEDVREAREALSAGDYSSTLGAAYKIAHGRDPHAVVTNKDLENALGSTGLDRVKDWLTTNDPTRVPDLNEVEKARLFKVVDGLEKVASINMQRKYEKFRKIPVSIPNGEMKDGFDAYVQSQFGGFPWFSGTQSGRPGGGAPAKKGPAPSSGAVDDLVKGVQ